jgi:hypothetical protein
MEQKMTFIDPNRPGIAPAQPVPPRRNLASAFDDEPRVDGWTANRPRSSGLMLAGGITVALMIAGWVTFSGMIETGSAANTPSAATSQPTIVPAVSPVAPTTTGPAPAR